ncbi:MULTISPECIES: peptidoglycan DD-metalloendopeptidase family protein [Psychrilyobacter]|uniref:LysM peptidoglycan-binding domain-containing protein n=1 Tax=Psychrilyobacter piezotolerans TaxID=2293438 RepID=A0ABX9KI73_9FUSO|nr:MULTISPECIES: M23 family metallopeptidase [Psychrilyobacter]MCS5422630.1 M23 family metallopeptidase [Psychrilyobacter sp. S5]NDI77635.1 M23 family metallopeptidase [Psychrilyobacter piezotolerans]RDE62644.1 M23 family peptidase [Psychrilyobacter sp. S5]REI41574.1 LysM peptidoglycan-binding domain-containing protein [Psychrilyobacter piezotolerans]
MRPIQKMFFIIITSVILISCSNSKYHTVKKGDTLYSIAQKRDVPVPELKDINNLESNLLYSGQKIYLKPSKNYKGSYHMVRSGDTLYSISKKYDVKVDHLKKINDLKNNTLYKGDKIYLGKMVNKGDLNFSSSSTTTYKNNSKDSILKNFGQPLKTMTINSPYGYRDHPVLGRRILHTGVDLKASTNTPVYSPYSGIVTYAGWMNGYGKIIIIDNGNNYETRFAHLNRILVKKGQTVKKGKVLAKSGKTGRVTGPHLHYEIRYKNQSMNPMKF